jgi:putative oxidoreductase
MHILFSIARVLLVLTFVVSGAMKLLDIPGTAAQIAPVITIPDALSDPAKRLQELTGTPIPQLLAISAGVVEVLAALLIAFNIGARAAAMVLVLFTVAATFYFHAFWNMTGEPMQANMIQALKNLSIIGGLLIMVVLGSWRPMRSNEV